MTEQVCPLCQTAKHMRRTKMLYGTPVCKRCYYRFANRRQLAYIVDAMIWWPISFVLGYGLGLILESGSLAPSISAFLYIGFGWVIFPMIFFCKDSFGGHSPGKWVCGVRVVYRDGVEPIGIASSFKRNLPLMIPLMPLVVAFLLQKGHRLGDGWAKSKVVWKRYANHPVFTGLFACQRCQFDLTGNTSGVCPECGTPVPYAAPRPSVRAISPVQGAARE